MSQYERLSIWENDPLQMNWYDHAVGRKTPSEPFVTPNTGMDIFKEEEVFWTNTSCSELAYQDIWFNELAYQDREQQGVACAKNEAIMDNSTQVALSSNVQMVAPCDPYFEYLFADAGLPNGSGHSDNSIDDLSFDKYSGDDDCVMTSDPELDAPLSPSESGPATPEPEVQEPQFINVSPLLKAETVETGVNIISRALRNTYIAAAVTGSDGTNSAGRDVGVQKSPTTSIQQANVNFFGEYVPPNDRTRLQAPPASASVNTFIFHGQQTQERRMLRAKTPKTRFERLNRQPARTQNVGRSAVQKSKSSATKVAKDARKRSVSAFLDEVDKILAGFDSSKRARVEPAQPTFVHHTIPTVNQSFFSDTTTSSCQQASEDFFNHEPLAIAPKGYAGQFDGMIIKHNFMADFKFNLTSLDKYKSGIHFTFGDRRHPNGLYTHTSIITDPLRDTPDFTEKELPDGHPLRTCMSFATDMTDAASHVNVVKLRSHDEEILRRESHIECAHARLEGVAVGYYRYYQGHLNIEEYHDAEMCIC